jgi:hypothetical protein
MKKIIQILWSKENFGTQVKLMCLTEDGKIYEECTSGGIFAGIGISNEGRNPEPYKRYWREVRIEPAE